MIDTARHFFPLSDLRRTIDGMEVSKMNRLHLHLIDSQSFPLKWPGMDGQGTLWQLGAFKDAQGNPQAYSAAELADLVDYGRRRGVEVYPELTMPGHADVFNLVYPEIMSCNPDMSRPSGQLQPLVDRTYDVLENLFAWGMDQAFASSPAWHIGSDEVHKWCWNWNNIVANYDFLTAYKRFQTFVSDQVVSQRDRLMVTWEDLVTPSSLEGSGLNYETIGDDGTVVPPMASKKMVVQAWRSIDTYNWLIAKGYETLFSVSDWWYFTCGQWCTPGTGSRSMTTAYNAPIPATGSAPANFKGGEAAFWSEETYSGVLDKVVWPRSGAVAERLWTNGNAALSGQLCTETRTDRLNRQLTSVGIAPWPASTVMN
ncbi:glycoside hydrolase superfamily [Hyaloraphidium curvatum]|nr:glycoside hydrolase superfamily [Hyaloraphidium curvatum]